MIPETRSEIFLANIAGEQNELPAPQSRIEHYLNAIAQAGDIHGGSAGAVIYDKDASYPDGSVGAAMQEMDGEITENAADVAQLKSQINEVESGFPQKTASGSIVTIEDGADNVPVVGLTAEIVPVQSGTGDPAPDNVRPISGWTGANIPVTGKNLWGGEVMADEIVARVNASIDASKGTDAIGKYVRIRAGGNTNSKPLFVIPNPTAGKRYTLILKAGNSSGTTSINIGWLYSDGTVSKISLPSAQAVGTATTFATTSSSTKTLVAVCGYWASGYGYFYYENCGLFEGVLTTDDFAPYIGNVTKISWETEAGTVYGGSITLNQDGTADLTVEIAITDLGAKTWTAVDSFGGSYQSYISGHNSATGFGLCEGLAVVYSGADLTASSAGLYMKNNGDAVFAHYPAASDADEFKAAMNGVHCCYELTTPVTYHIENVELVKTLYLLNNIWADTGDVSLTYRADPATYTSEQIRIMLNAMVAPVESSTTASKAYNVNDFLIMDNVLYKVISPSANGGTITVDTNVSATTVGAELTAILNS